MTLLQTETHQNQVTIGGETYHRVWVYGVQDKEGLIQYYVKDIAGMAYGLAEKHAQDLVDSFVESVVEQLTWDTDEVHTYFREILDEELENSIADAEDPIDTILTPEYMTELLQNALKEKEELELVGDLGLDLYDVMHERADGHLIWTRDIDMFLLANADICLEEYQEVGDTPTDKAVLAYWGLMGLGREAITNGTYILNALMECIPAYIEKEWRKHKEEHAPHTDSA